MPDVVAQVEDLTRRYGDFEAVSGLSLDLGRGEVLALLGPNGAGKTTTIRMLMGILRPTSGAARVMGRDCFRERHEVMRYVGYLPDDPIFYDYLTGREIIRFVGEMHGLADAAVRARADEFVGRFDLGDALDEYAVNYSRGMKKKLALVCALLHEPELLILDEPTSGLDPFATRDVNTFIREMAAAGRTVFLSTHLLDQAEHISDRVAILHKGRLAAMGRMDELRAGLREGSTLEEIFFSVARTPEETADGAAR